EQLDPFKGEPLRFINLSPIKTQIELTDQLKQKDTYYIRGNKAHLIQDIDNNQVFIYFDESWRTTIKASELKKDDFIFLLSNNTSHLYTITGVSQSVEDFSKKYPIYNNKPLLIIFIEKKK